MALLQRARLETGHPHALIMDLIAREISDSNILGLIKKFLQAGVMEEGEVRPTTKGTPQGGIVSPLIANIVLDHLDWRLEPTCLRIDPAHPDVCVKRDHCKAIQSSSGTAGASRSSCMTTEPASTGEGLQRGLSAGGSSEMAS